ncbi:phage late control D family protein [Rhizobium halophytocola]|uniref:Phage protein D n=2 Tax=Rhizobium halophytocola TaxID=735519 RepID=A0ABS4E2E2_9HYPH|nr:phage protein D [Rhizobium halophytocola]
MPWTVDWAVFIDGRNMTSAMRPYLLQISVTDKDGTASDSCSLSLDDTGGQLKLPGEGASVKVFLQGVAVFDGTIDSVRSSGSRGGGRELAVTAKGFDTKGKAKQLQSHHMDEASLSDFLGKAAEKAGLAGITIAPAFAAITRSYWSADAESFLHLGQKLARELGGTFKIRGDQAVLAERGEGASPAGGALPTIAGTIGKNVISWDISPVTGRAKFKKAKARYFDRKSATFRQIEVDTDFDAEAEDEARTVAADEGQASDIAKGKQAASKRGGGEGSVELDLEPEAQAEGTFVLGGARPGVDGVYRITGVTHRCDRSGGSTTSLELKQPQGGAGSDNRGSG